MKIKNKQNQFDPINNAGFSVAWFHLYIMICMIIILATAPFFGFIIPSITVITFGLIGAFKIIETQDKTKVKATNRYECMAKKYSDIKNRCNETNAEIKLETQDDINLCTNDIPIKDTKIFLLQQSI